MIATNDAQQERLLFSTAVGYHLVVVVHLLLLFALAIWPREELTWLYCSASLATAVLIVVMTYTSGRVVVTPLTLFATVWLVLVPLAAFEAPLMRPASSEELWTTLVGGVAFSAGGLIATLVNGGATARRPRLDTLTPDPDATRLTRIAALLLYTSILALVANTLLEGSFALLRGADMERKAQSAFLGYPMLSSIGSIALVVFARSPQGLQKRHLMAGVTYLVLQLLTGQRFVAIITLVMILIAQGSNASSSRPKLGRTILVALGVVGAFMFVANFRGGESDQRRYFLETGVYTGDPVALGATELVRYVGMSQRNMSTVMDRRFDVEQLLEHTASPILSLFGEPLGGLGTSISGYTANNAIAYLYHDAGDLWPLLALLWGLGVNWIYWQSRRWSGSLALAYVWYVSAMGLVLSFFAYVSAYVYWVLVFPLIVCLIERASRPKTIRSTRTSFAGRVRSQRMSGRRVA